MFLRAFAPTVCALAFVASPALAQSTGPYSRELLAPFKPLNSRLSDSTVRVQSDEVDVALGTVVSADGYILTKASELRVEQGSKIAIVLKDGTAYDVEVVSVHEDTDLALLKLDLKKAGLPPMKPVKFVDTKNLPTGHWLLASGPRSDPVAVGIISVPTRNLTGPDRDTKDNYNRGLIGISTEESTDPKGARIISVQKDSAGEAAGLLKDDVVLEVEGKPVNGPDAIRKVLSNYRKEDVVVVKFVRDKTTKEVNVTLAARVLDKDRDRGEIMNKFGSTLSGRRTGFPTVLQSDMIVNAKDCGGPVCDLEGNVLGISIARAGRVETWVLPSETIRPILTDMRAGKYPVPAPIKKAVVKTADQ